jgi:hypothetical protein
MLQYFQIERGRHALVDVPVGNQNMPFAQALLLMPLDVPLAQVKKNGIQIC